MPKTADNQGYVRKNYKGRDTHNQPMSSYKSAILKKRDESSPALSAAKMRLGYHETNILDTQGSPTAKRDNSI